MLARLRSLIPDDTLTRQLSLQSMLFAFGAGIFLTGNAVYFTKIVGLSAAQVGLGLSISGLVALTVSIPMGKVADRVGSLKAWWLSALVSGLLHLAYPLIHGFAAFAALLSVMAVVDGIGGAGRGAYLIDVFAPDQRVRGQAFSRSALNVGFTIGALIGGLALATGSTAVIRAVPILTAVVLLINAGFVARLPAVRRSPTLSEVTPESLLVADDSPSGGGFQRSAPVTAPARSNKGFVAMSALSGILGAHEIILTIVIPLWLVERTDAPHWTLAWLFGTNTVLAVLLQVPVARRVHDVATSLRGIRIAALFVTLSCVVIAVTGDTIGWWSVILLLLGHMTVTGAELFESAATWGFLSELTDPARRGEYQGVWSMGGQLTNIVGPALFTWLALDHGAVGWAAIAVLVLTAAALVHAAARSAARFLRAQGERPATVHSPI